jgi:hypothetical protein
MTREGSIELGVERQVVDEWPQPVAEDGWREGVSVLMPKKYMERLATPLKNDVVVIPMPEKHNGVAIRIFFEDPDAVTAAFPAAFPIAVLDRPKGALAYVIAEPVQIEVSQFRSFEEMCDSARQHIPLDQLQQRNRFIGLGTMDQRRIAIDLCVVLD